MQTQQLKAFRCVMKYGTTIAAANVMGISQPAVTRLLKSLENDVGFALFERSHQHLVPTPEAHVLIRDAEGVYQAMSRIEGTAARLREEPEGSLRIAALPLLSVAFIPQVLAAFSDEMKARFVLRNYRSEQIIRSAATQEYDIGFCIADSPPVNVDTLRFRGEHVCLLPPKSRLINEPVLEAQHLAGKALVCYEHDCPQKAIDAQFDAAGVQYRRVAEASFAFSIGTMVEAGLGYAILDPFTAILFSERGLAFKPYRPALPFEFDILIPYARPLSRTGEAFLRTFFAKVDDEGVPYTLEGMSAKARDYIARLRPD